SLPIVEGNAAVEVMSKLRTVAKNTDDPETIRQVILLGVKLQEPAVPAMVALLRHWTGQDLLEDNAPWKDQIQAWQEWYSDEYPVRRKAEMRTVRGVSTWKFVDPLALLNIVEGGSGSLPKGVVAFGKAYSVKCHRYG